MSLRKTKKQLDRFNELKNLLGSKNKLTPEEYKAALHEIRANYVIALQIQSITGEIHNTGAMMNIIDKVHWLLDSVESKETKSPGEDNYTVNIRFLESEKTDIQN